MNLREQKSLKPLRKRPLLNYAFGEEILEKPSHAIATTLEWIHVGVVNPHKKFLQFETHNSQFSNSIGQTNLQSGVEDQGR